MKSNRYVSLMVMVVLLASLWMMGGSTAAAASDTANAAAGGRSISGVVWQDYCESDCTAGSSLRRGNGSPDEAEKRLDGITVRLGNGRCGVSRTLSTTTTDSSGSYSFSGLSAGTYCVSVNSRQSNSAFPKPGVWTRPMGRSAWYIASYTVHLSSFNRSGLNFGWDKE